MCCDHSYKGKQGIYCSNAKITTVRLYTVLYWLFY